MAFLSRYKEMRPREHEEETNYNIGRAYHQLCGCHQLGILDLHLSSHTALFSEALQLYERVLSSVEARLEADPHAVRIVDAADPCFLTEPARRRRALGLLLRQHTIWR